MEKKRNSCRDGCEKFFKSITVISPFRAIRPISHDQRHSTPPNPSPSASIPAIKNHHADQLLKTQKKKEAAEAVPITFVNDQVVNVATKADQTISQIASMKTAKTQTKAEVTEPEKSATRKSKLWAADKTSPALAVGHGRQEAKTNGKAEPPPVSRMKSNKLGANMEVTFTDYINHAKVKLSTTSSVDGNKASTSGQDDDKDPFSAYINRTKKKMLSTMTSFIGGKE